MSRTPRLALLAVAALWLAGCTAPGGVREDVPLNELRARADGAYARGEWDGAARDYEAITVRAPTVVDAWIRLGNARARLRQPEQALAAYREALIRDPRSARAWHNLGMVELRQALVAFAQLRQVTPADSPLHQRAADLVEALGALAGGSGDAATAPADDRGDEPGDG